MAARALPVKTYLVGGAVRDKLLGIEVLERDWVVVGAEPGQMLEAGFTQVGKDFPVFLHPESKEEYALARTERKAGSGYHGFDVYAAPDVSLEDDLLRRDLTINAIAEASNGELIDPYGGQRDIEAKILRHVSPAFAEDPLRVLRVARFAARLALLGFSIADETLALMTELSTSGELETLAAERRFTEIRKGITAAAPEVFFRVLRECKALPRLSAELDAACSETALKLLASHSETLDKDFQRMALLLQSLDEVALRRVFTTLRFPKEWQQFCTAIQRLATTFRGVRISNGDQAITLFDCLDCWRNPQRLTDAIPLLPLLGISTNTDNVLQGAFEEARQINAEAVLTPGLKGPQIGTAIRRARSACLDKHLNIEEA